MLIRYLSPGRLGLLVAASILFAPRVTFAQELKLRFSSYESPVAYDSVFLAEWDILNATVSGSAGSHQAVRCPSLDRQPSSTLQLLGYCVIPEYVLQDLEQGTPELYSGANGAIDVDCGICPRQDEYGNYLCAPYEKDCATETGIKAKIEDHYRAGGYCKHALNSESGWSYFPSDPGWWTGTYPGDTAAYRILYTKSVTYDAWLPTDFNGCNDPVKVQHNWGLTSKTFKSCPLGYYRTDFSIGDPVTGPSCGNSYDSRLQMFANKEKSAGGCGTGNPCYPTTGVKTLSEIDFSSPTLSLTRYFHTEMWEQDYAAMGRGWSHTYSERLLPGNGGMLRHLDGSGNVERFVCADAPACSVYRSGNAVGSLLRPVAGGWEIYAPDGRKRVFDGAGRLIVIEDRAGAYRQLSISYTKDDKVDMVMDQQGRALQFSYNADGLVDIVTLPGGAAIQYRYNLPASVPAHAARSQQLVKVIREDLSELAYHYEDQHPDASPRYEFLVTGVTDENGARHSTFTYDQSARVIRSELAGGAELVTLDYTNRPGETESWTITKLTRPLGEVETYSIKADPFRKPTRITDSRGAFSIGYDYRNWPVSRLDREGNQTTYAYADGLHETRRTEAAGTPDERVIETDWDDAVNRVSERREPGRNVRYTYNARGQVLTRVEIDTAGAVSRTWSHTYFEAPASAELVGRLKAVDGPRTDVSDITTYSYFTTDDPGGDYLKGDLRAVSNAMGHVIEFLAYDGDGRLLQASDANGVITTLAYHPRGWLRSRAIDGQVTSFSYDNAGNLTRITQPDGSFIDYEYDDAHRLEAIADNFNNRIEYTLDAASNRVAEKVFNDAGSLRRQMSRVYDQLNRLQMVIDGNLHATIHGYDSNGNRTSSRDPNLNTSNFEFDPLDRLVRTIDPALGETILGYDDRDNLASVTDPLGHVTTYTYDGLDNLTRLDSRDSGTTTWEYDAAGNRTSGIDARGVRVEYRYDALNRLTLVDYADDRLDVIFTYDAGANGIGRLSSTSDAGGTETYAYDARGNLVSVVRHIDGASFTTAYAYNGADRLTRITYPSGMVIDYMLDAAGRIIGVDETIDSVTRSLVSGVVHEPYGPISKFTFGNGLVMEATFDQDYELTVLQSGVLDRAFDYDDTGNILSITDWNSSARNEVFAYDQLNRLVTATGSYGTESFGYDANGNRARYGDGLSEELYSYEPQSSRLASRGGWIRERDGAGNLTRKLDGAGYGKLYGYGDHNRLERVTDRDATGDTQVGLYVYDGRGQRISKTSAGVTTYFVYGLNGELLGEYGENVFGPVVREYVYLDGQPVAFHENRSEGYTPPPSDVVIDNGGPDTSSVGNWSLRTDPQQYGSDFRLTRKKADSVYRWILNDPIGADADVYAWWVDSKGFTARAEYTVSHQNGAKTDLVVKSQKTSGGQWNYLGTYYFSGGPGDYIEVSAAHGRTNADAIRLRVPARPVVRLIKGTRFIHTDHLGTPRVVSDESQAVLWRWNSGPFGDSVPEEDPDGDGDRVILNLRFPGQYFDAESGLHYNYFRDYDPGTGRYVQSDPIGLSGGINLFTYGAANPMGFIDPSGLEIVGSWASAPRAYDIKAGFPRWKGYEFGDPRILPPGIRVGWFEVDVSARVSYQVRCQEFPESERSCLDERPRTWFLSSSDAGPISHKVAIPYRFSIGPAWFKWSVLTARIAREAEQKARSALARLARELYKDPTLMCIFSQ